MFLSDDLKENLWIFSNNLSYYYIFCVIISVIAVFVACFCQKTLSEIDLKQELDFSQEESDKALEALDNTDEEKSGLSGLSSDPSGTDSTDLHLLADSPVDSVSSTNSSANSVVTSEREMLIDSIASMMAPNEVMIEREIERQQLEEIFKLVNEQKDVFKIDSVEDLEDQLKLYR